MFYFTFILRLYVFVKECAEENNDEGAKEHSGTMDKNLLSQFYDGGPLFKWKVEPVLLWWTIVQWKGRIRE